MMNLSGHTSSTQRGLASLVLCFVVAAFFPNVSSSQQTQWNGLSQFWRADSNWSSGIPTATLSVIISKSNPTTPSDTYVPVPAGGDTAQTKDLTIQSGGVLRFDSAGVLIVNGIDKSQNDGQVFLGEGKIIFKNNIKFLNGGEFDAGSGTIEFSGGSWTNKASSYFDAGTSTVVFNGTGSQTLTINDTSNFSFYNLQIYSGGTVSINGDLIVNGDCYLAPGTSVNVGSGSTLTINGTFDGEPGQISGEGSTSLPVQLSSFTASANRLGANLHWATETEVNNYGFEIERRKISQIFTDSRGFESQNDGVGSASAWSRIGFVQGSGTSSSPKEYSFADKLTTPGRYAYRLKQIDFDGTFAYYSASEIEIGLAPKELMLGSNYPNPFNPTTNIEFTIPESGRATLRVFNMIGQQVATLFDGAADGGRIYQVTFSASVLPSGLYFYRLEYGNQISVKKMTLVK